MPGVFGGHLLTWRADRSRIYPPLADALDALLQPSPFQWFAISGERSLVEQARLYLAYQAWLKGTGPQAGRAAPPGQSAHNPRGTPPYGFAVDLVLDVDPRPGLQPSWDRTLPGWQWLKKSIPLTHPTLVHGRTFGDWPHVEWKAWRTIPHHLTLI